MKNYEVAIDVKSKTSKGTIFEEAMEKQVKTQNDKMIDDVFSRIKFAEEIRTEPKEGFEKVQA